MLTSPGGLSLVGTTQKRNGSSESATQMRNKQSLPKLSVYVGDLEGAPAKDGSDFVSWGKFFAGEYLRNTGLKPAKK